MSNMYVYEDVDTGIMYVYDGKDLIPINAPSNSKNGKFDLSKTDEKTLKREEQERQEQIEKEIEEYGELDPESEEAEAKLEDISELFDDEQIAKDLMSETEKPVKRDAQARKRKQEEEDAAKRAAEKYKATSGIGQFILDINKLIAKQVKKMSASTWKKMNAKYDGSGIIKPGKIKKDNPKIPTLYVYFDQSGSWGSDDIKVGEEAIKSLNVYVKKGQLDIKLFYFASSIGTTPEGAGVGWYECFEKVNDHINKYRPDNVMIMTDSDGDYYLETTHLDTCPLINVKGGMFLLFRRGAVSRNVVRVYHGKQFTKIYRF